MKLYHRSILLLMVLSLSTLLVSCAGFRPLTQEESEKVFTHEVKLSKTEIKTKLLSMISEKFKSGKSVIQVNEDGLISGNAVDFLDSDPLGMIKTYIELTFMVKYQDNQYKIKFIVKNIYSEDSKSTYDVHPSVWGRYAEEVNKKISDFDKMTLSYVSNNSSNF